MKNIFKRLIALVLSLTTALTLVGDLSLLMPLSATSSPAEPSSNTMTVVVTHWHLSTETGSPVGAKDGGISIDDAKEEETFTLNSESGTQAIIPKPYPLNSKDGVVYENFESFSVTAGHSAVTDEKSNTGDNNSSLTVTYDPNVRLVKIDVYYKYAETIVAGTTYDQVFANESEGEKDPERDTSIVYAYPSTVDSEHAGKPIENEAANNYFAYDEKRTKQPDAIDAANKVLGAGTIAAGTELPTVKVYSTSSGLHTDKTATVDSEDASGRTFDLDLEAWFSGENVAEVGLVLDSSGSMAFPSEGTDSKNFVKVQADEKADYYLGMPKLAAPTSKDEEIDWDDYFLEDSVLNQILDPLKTDNSPNGYNGYTYYIFDSRSNTREFTPIGYWDGTNLNADADISPDDSVYYYNEKFPSAENLIGYYPFDRGAYTDATGASDSQKQRDWNLNIVSGNYAKRIEQVTAESFTFVPLKEVKVKDSYYYYDESVGYDVSYPDSADVQPNGLILDVVPSNNNFTISFRIRQKAYTGHSDTTSSVDQKADEILYIGSLDSQTTGSCFRLYRAGGSSRNKIKATDSAYDVSERLYNGEVNEITKNSNEGAVYTFVFSETEKGRVNVKTYVNGVLDTSKKTNGVEISDLSGRNIIFNGFIDEYNGINQLVDDLYVFDCSLRSEEVMNLYNYTTKNSSELKELKLDVGTSTSTEYYQKQEDEEQNTKKKTLIVTKHWILERKTGSDKVDYFSVGSAKVAQINDYEKTEGSDKSGWYYVSSTSNYYANLRELGSAKTYNGLKSEVNYRYTGNTAAYGESRELVEDGTPYYNYKSGSKGSAMKFFVDSMGNLCCFYNTGGKDSDYERYGWSYVYKKADDSPTKEEVLQRALGLFATRLHEATPSSIISATKFSTVRISPEDYDQLVLLNWTTVNDSASNVVQVISPNKDKGNPASNDDGQYNYIMTGGTNTYTGLQSFVDNLMDKEPDDKKGINKKYLILFTDGKDTSLDNSIKLWQKDNPDEELKDFLPSLIRQTKAYKLAQQIKENGYTIFSVMLAAGTVGRDTEDYNQAVEFLAMLSGSAGKEETIVYGKPPTRTDNGKDTNRYENVYESNNAPGLVQIFSESIVERISDDLSAYTVKDYLDPRFNLVDASGNVWKLNRNGAVEVVSIDADGKETPHETHNLLSGETPDPSAPITLAGAHRDDEGSSALAL